jgi:hypothetical protein
MKLARNHLLYRITEWTSWSRFHRKRQVRFFFSQYSIDYSDSVILGFNKWLPEALMTQRSVTKRRLQPRVVSRFMRGKAPFIRTFKFPTRFSLLKPTPIGWKEHLAILPGDAAEADIITRSLRNFLPSCPRLLSCCNDADYD